MTDWLSTQLIKGEQLKTALIGKKGGVMAACKAMKNFNTAKDLNVIRQSLWFLDEVLQHDRNIYMFCHYKGPELYAKMLELRAGLEDPGTIFLPKKLGLLIRDRLPEFQKAYEKDAAAKQIEFDKQALEEAKRRKARRYVDHNIFYISRLLKLSYNILYYNDLTYP